MFNPIFSIIAIVLSLSFGFFYVKPEYDTTLQRRADFADLDKTIKDSKEIGTLIKQTESTLSSINAAGLARFAIFLPEETDSLRLSNTLQHIGLSHGVMLTKIKVEESTKNPQTTTTQASESGIQVAAAALKAVATAQKYATTKTTFEFASSDIAFRSFLIDLEKSLGLMNVTALTFSPLPESADAQKFKITETPRYQYQITIETYSLK